MSAMLMAGVGQGLTPDQWIVAGACTMIVLFVVRATHMVEARPVRETAPARGRIR